MEKLLAGGMCQYLNICVKDELSMIKNGPKRNSPEASGKVKFLGIIRAYLSAILLIHRNLGALRVTAAYIFAIFAVCSLLFTIRVPVLSSFLPPTREAKAQSRAITGFMMIINIIVYGMILNWRKSGTIRSAIRIVLIGVAFYLDTFLIRVIYILMRDKALF